MRKAPDKIYRNTDKTGYVCWSETEFVKPYSATAYIRKDLIEHIIGGALGPQDALNKIRSL